MTPTRTPSTKLGAAILGALLLAYPAVAQRAPGDRPAAAAPAGQQQQPRAAKPAAPAAGNPVVLAGLGGDGKLQMMVNTSKSVTTRLPYKTISIANPEIADFNRVDDSVILVTAKKPGATQLTLWDTGGRSQSVDVTVESDVVSLQAQLDRIFPGAGIQATNVNGTVALRGRVKDLDVAKQAVAVAEPYSTTVLNFLEVAGGQQVMLQVRFAEVSRSASSQLGFSTFATDGPASSARSTARAARRSGRWPPAPRRRSTRRHDLRRRRARQRRVRGVRPGPAPQQPAARAGRAEPDRDERAGGELPGRRRVPDPGPAGRRGRLKHDHDRLQAVRRETRLRADRAGRRQDPPEG
jgi:hypothetical protein